MRDLRLDDGLQLSGAGGEAVNQRGSACGKAILLGEHLVVHGAPAIAVPLVGRRVEVTLVPRAVAPSLDPAMGAWVERMLGHLGIDPQITGVRVASTLPIASGLGSSAALAVALVRALGETDVDTVRARAHELERLAHGNPSGIDDAVVASERGIVFRRGGSPALTVLSHPVPSLWVAVVPRVITTREAVAGVARWVDAHRERFQGMLDEMGTLVDEAIDALASADEARLGALLDRAHAMLDALGVVDPRHAAIVRAARAAGALGAKTTGAGHGGAVIAIGPRSLALEAPLIEAGAHEVFHSGPAA